MNAPTADRVIRWAARSSEFAVCVECGAEFPLLDERMTFCPPPPGIKESRCAQRHRQRRYRSRQKEETT